MLTEILTIIAAITPISLIVYKTAGLISKDGSNISKTTTICTNIIGNLMKSELKVRSIILDNLRIKVDKFQFEVDNLETKENFKINKDKLQINQSLELTTVIGVLCQYEKVQELEKIIKTFLESLKGDIIKIKRDYEIIDKIAEDEEERKISTVIVQKRESREIFTLTKGNAYKVLEKCSRIMINGKKTDLTNADKRKIRDQIKKLNQKGEKVIAFAYKALPIKRQTKYTKDFAEKEMTFLSFFGLKADSKKGIMPQIELAKKAGIKIHILTGIKERNAVAIGKELHLINRKYFEAINSNLLNTMNDKKLSQLLSEKQKDYIFCELNKEEQKRVIKTLKSNEEIVSTTNENDPHSLKKIIKSIEKGRKIRKNLDKIFLHAISCKILEIALITLAFIIGNPKPLTIITILIIDLTINSMLELSMKVEKIELKPIKNQQSPKPFKITKSFISDTFTKIIITSGIFLYTLLSHGWIPGDTIESNDPIMLKSITIIFILIGLIQIFEAFKLRNKKAWIFKNFFKNPYLILTSLISILIIYASTIPSEIQTKLGFSEIAKIDWQAIIFALIVIIILEEGRKYISKNLSKK